MSKILLETDHTARFLGLRDQDKAPVAGATVTAVLLSRNKEVLDPQPKPFPLTFTDAGDGQYTTAIPHDHELKAGDMYSADIKAKIGNIQRTWYDDITVAHGKF